jgi:hypothetical protein
MLAPAAPASTQVSQLEGAEFFLPSPAKVHKAGGADQNKKNRLANLAAAGIESLLPVVSHDAWKAEDKCPRPENCAGAGHQDGYPPGFLRHNSSWSLLG